FFEHLNKEKEVEEHMYGDAITGMYVRCTIGIDRKPKYKLTGSLCAFSANVNSRRNYCDSDSSLGKASVAIRLFNKPEQFLLREEVCSVKKLKVFNIRRNIIESAQYKFLLSPLSIRLLLSSKHRSR
ncbi:Protein of unknown function, partial [Cotesia congregata]